MLFAGLVAHSQINLPKDENGKVVYTNVIKTPELSASKIYSSLKIWLARNYNSLTHILKVEDEASYTLVVKPIVRVFLKNKWDAGKFTYTLTLQAKDGKFRYEITDFIHDRVTSGGYSCGEIENENSKCANLGIAPKYWDNVRLELHKKMIILSENLDTAINSSQSNNDW
jgi:hypothetical protein